MFTKTLLFIGLLSVAPLASASPISDLARATGLTERNVAMVLGAPTAYGEYRTSYDRVLRQFKEVVGESNYQKLINGESIVLEPRALDKDRAVALEDSTKP